MTAPTKTFKVEARRVWKSFDSTPILRDVSLTVDAGEVKAIIGPSGAGKSTFLRCVNHLEVIDRGYIAVDGEMIGYRADGTKLRILPNELVSQQRARVGMVFQHFNLFRHMTVLDNIAFAPRRVLGMSRATAADRARVLLQRMGLAHKDAAYPAELSGGQQQRVAIARTLAMDPTLLLLDEPTSALDPELSGEVVAVIRSLAEEGRTMVVATHDLGLVRDIADTIVFMVDGEVVEEGSMRAVLDNPSHERTRSFLSTLARAAQ